MKKVAHELMALPGQFRRLEPDECRARLVLAALKVHAVHRQTMTGQEAGNLVLTNAACPGHILYLHMCRQHVLGQKACI